MGPQLTLTNMKETWAAIPGYEGSYEASDLGNIRRIAKWPGARPAPYALKPATTIHGYNRVVLTKHGEHKPYSIHRLVMAAFHGESDKQVNHKNLNKQDNRLENLEYVTHKENTTHASNAGVRPHGSRHGMSKLDENQVREIRRLRELGESTYKLADRFHVTRQSIRYVLTDGWKHITS